MRYLDRTLAFLALACASMPVGAQQPPGPPPPSVKVGEPAPAFRLPYLAEKAGGGFEPRYVTLDEYRGKKNVVVAFFPAAFSPG